MEYYGHKYPIEDCRSGVCRHGYLLWNGYIPAHQINSTDLRTGKPNGVMGVPDDYKPARRAAAVLGCHRTSAGRGGFVAMLFSNLSGDGASAERVGCGPRESQIPSRNVAVER